ncbi:MAG TPA: 23S rRNA (uracil(1939)-C(5))-methyltransferase RlmD [Actinobacteria bacterium]|nr:23S rRNA (uracil(1939)-C(5))-methyltransferase RlmD [Actinomycetota bacterium]
MDKITVEIVKLVNGGQGLGFHNGKPVFAWNVLPGETAVVKLTKKKTNYLEGIAVGISDASPERINPEEDHFISCSPWQNMTFNHENHWKRKIAKETFRRTGNIELPDLEIVHEQVLFGYRNKNEYSFCVSENGHAVSLAFHQRGTTNLIPIDKCLLAKENINKAALHILDQLNMVNAKTGDLKSLILRENHKGLVVAVLTVNNKHFQSPGIVCDDILKGFHIRVANPKGAVIGPFTPEQSQGDNFIIEEIAGKNFICGPLSFFQVNIDIFDKTLARIGAFIDDGDEIVDFYSGVGTIGIALGDKVKSGVLVESNQETSRFANENIRINELKNFAARAGSSETMLSEIKKNKTIILDPPRAGLHPNVVGKILEILPRRIIYLSCDTATQARDLKVLKQKYGPIFCELYNFFPRTPHIESLVVLESG